MTKPILKAYYGDIFFEFLVHDKEEGKREGIVILPGFPSSNKYDSEMRYLYEKGYNVFFPRYKGTYQSKGKFLDENIVEGLKKFLEELKKGKAKSLWDNSLVNFSVENIIIFGGSFSGAISCGLCALDKEIKKLVLFSPVWDFKKHNESGDEQDLNKLIPFVKRAYENLYRIKFTKLSEEIGKFKECSPEFYLEKLNKNKTEILVLHDPKDTSVTFNNSLNMSNKLPNIKLIRHSKGHAWDINLIEENWKEIGKFLMD